MTKEKTRYIFMDICKFICAFLVVGIHTSAMFIGSENLKILARIAVPFFFIVSGFFTSKASVQTQSYWQYIKKTLKYILFALAIYLVYNIIHMCLGGQFTGEHLWFLVALFTAKSLHFVLIRRNCEKFYLLIIIAVLALNYCLSNLHALFSLPALPIYVTRNGLLFGLPFFLLGYKMIGLQEKFAQTTHHKLLPYILLAAAVGCTVLQLCEARFLIWLELAPQCEFFITSIFGAFFLMLFCLLMPKANYRPNSVLAFSNLPFNIYIFHLIVYNILALIAPALCNAVHVYIITFVLCYLGLLFKKYIIIKKILPYLQKKLHKSS